MESHLTFKVSNGFTLIEIMLVISLVCIIGAFCQIFVLPSLVRVACEREIALAFQKIEDARFSAQYYQNDFRVDSSGLIFKSGRGNIESNAFEFLVSSSTAGICDGSIKLNNIGDIV